MENSFDSSAEASVNGIVNRRYPTALIRSVKLPAGRLGISKSPVSEVMAPALFSRMRTWTRPSASPPTAVMTLPLTSAAWTTAGASRRRIRRRKCILPRRQRIPRRFAARNDKEAYLDVLTYRADLLTSRAAAISRASRWVACAVVHSFFYPSLAIARSSLLNA